MALIGRLHALLIHFPIALVIVAALAEVGAMGHGGRGRRLRLRWRREAFAVDRRLAC